MQDEKHETKEIEFTFNKEIGWVGPPIKTENQRKELLKYIGIHKEKRFALFYLLEVDSPIDEDDK